MRSSFWQYAATVFMAFAALFLPFWAVTLVFVAGIFLLPSFYAGLVILFVMDALYAPGGPRVGPFFGLLTCSGVALYLVALFVKERTTINVY